MSHRVRLSLIVYSSTSQKKWLQIPCIIWTCSVTPVTSLSVAFTSFAQKVAIDFRQSFSHLLRMMFSLNFWNKKWGSPWSFKSEEACISLSSLVLRKSLTFCTRARSRARADDAKIVRSRNALCKTRESPKHESALCHRWLYITMPSILFWFMGYQL